jgi:hypothetical protein
MDRKDWPWLGNLAAVQGYSTPLSCHHCEVTWEGCAAESCCPKCGAPKGYHNDDHGQCYCAQCQTDLPQPTNDNKPPKDEEKERLDRQEKERVMGFGRMLKGILGE